MEPRRADPVDSASPAICSRQAAGSMEIGDRSLLRRLVCLRRRLATGIVREGGPAFALRKTSQMVARLRERARVGWHGRRKYTADTHPVFLFISHRYGGGTEQHLRHLVIDLRREGVRVVIVRPSRNGFLLWEERDDRERVIWCHESSDQRASLERLLEAVKPAHAHIHHTLGISWALVDLLADQGITHDWTLHDYYAICPRINLVNGENSYCGEPDDLGCNQCLARNGDDRGRPVTIPIASWREESSRRLSRARRVIVPSADVRDRIQRYFPKLTVLLRPHPETLPDSEKPGGGTGAW